MTVQHRAVAVLVEVNVVLSIASSTRRTGLIFGWVVAVVILAAGLSKVRAQDALAIPQTHPRLFLHREDLGGLRARCGIGPGDGVSAHMCDDATVGSAKPWFATLERVADQIESLPARAGDLWVPAILHLTAGELGRPDRYTRWVARELLSSQRHLLELDGVVALDACWDALDPAIRGRIVQRWSSALRPFDLEQTPLNYYRFQRKLVGLALALVLAGEPEGTADPQRAARIQTVLSLAQVYLEGSLTRFIRQRGAMPTVGGTGVWEEASLVTALELWRTGAGRDLWDEVAGSLGRAMHHYFYADTRFSPQDHGFIHDFGSLMPLQPGRVFRGLVPMVPWAIARRTGDPIAAHFARQSLVPGDQTPVPVIDRYAWVPMVYGPLDTAKVARRACPRSVNLGGGWVVMRSGWNHGATTVLFDAGQPFWQSRQHFDAGQFQIYHKGRLAIDSGDDVTFDAVPAKGGKTTIGTIRGDWDDYYQATIAHNCVTVADRTLSRGRYGRPWPALGNQRLIEYDYAMTDGDILQTDRVTGRLLAFETNAHYSYAATDLTAAYHPQIVEGIHRQLVYLHAGALLVLDRVKTVKLRSIKTWHLQLPVRPRLIEGAPRSRAMATSAPAESPAVALASARQRHGVDQDAGVWMLDEPTEWIEIANGQGRLFVRTLLPERAQRRVLGGPMVAQQVLSGPFAGEAYFGGSQLGYEHRLWPGRFLRGPNAAYVLGTPTGLGPNFGVGATWGRLDVAPVVDVDHVTFLHLLVPTDERIKLPPAVRFSYEAPRARVEITLIDRQAAVTLDAATGRGNVRIVHPANGRVLIDQPLATTVQPDPSIPTVSSDDG